ncbi:MarR family winged helix-turn-helix transcriptional regulator [Aristaeella lactis]|uniref:DNA-binding transcriptional regulator, MarR family n=1 Tax=Aristaeella lactis TaxID=3046383 RepID=A0AC61PKI7_9FIRM|nr:MarR family transcriptional regulator [Aristaeella lactis]QUA51966.1 MarR family transcriptional regulator [Aristaeella lactis]SMC54115.1 DNA-binding transcriptional regulator, MarR family [Aristaeella lactis]
MMNRDSDVILASLKLARAMRRCPPERNEFPFPPAIGRLLECAARNPGVSSRELCEFLDLRPSSLSEMLSRAEADGLITRTVDEADRRVQRISLSDKGQKAVTEMENVRNLDAQKKTACLTEEEKEQFCLLCNKLSAHMERLALDLPEDRRMPPPPPGPDFPPRVPGFPHPGPDGQDDEKPRKPGRPPFPPGGRFKC